MVSALKKITLKTFITLCTFCLVATFSIKAQDASRITGKVIDAETGSPVVAATIVLGNSGKGYKSDVEGVFFLPAQAGKTYSIKVSSVGYSEKVLNDLKPESYVNNSLVISLDRANKEL